MSRPTRLEDPPPRRDAPRLQVLLDFDGTLVEPNVAIVLVERFCIDGPRIAHEVDLDLHAGRITLREAWARQVALLPPTRLDEMTEFVVREIPLRKGALQLLGLLREFQVPTAIVSGGLEFFIRRYSPARASTTRCSPTGSSARATLNSGSFTRTAIRHVGCAGSARRT